jgi:hypothetical protein
LAFEDFVLSCFPAIDWLGNICVHGGDSQQPPHLLGENILLLTFSADMDTLDVQYSLDIQYFWGRCHILLLDLIDMVN